MIKLNQNDVNKLQRKFHALKSIDQSGLKKEMYTAGALMSRDIKRSAPVDTGNLRNNVGFQPKENDITVFSNAPYSASVEYGTKARTISVKNAKVLTDGKTFFGKQVNIPAIKAQPFFYRNIEKGIKLLVKNLEYRIKRAIR